MQTSTKTFFTGRLHQDNLRSSNKFEFPVFIRAIMLLNTDRTLLLKPPFACLYHAKRRILSTCLQRVPCTGVARCDLLQAFTWTRYFTCVLGFSFHSIASQEPPKLRPSQIPHGLVIAIWYEICL
jgi:hypothetical protein